MKRALLAVVVASGFLAVPAQADSRHHRHWYGHAHVDSDAFWIGTGIVVGALTLGTLLSPPRVHAPAPYYYGPPPVAYYPPTRPYCVQDMVYRTLPDGRTQSGVRTTCY